MAEEQNTKLSGFILVFYSFLTSTPPQQWNVASPATPAQSHLPFILPSILDAYFWLVVVWKIINRQSPKAKALPIFLFFVVPFSHPKLWDDAPTHDPTRLRLLFNILQPPTVS
jgi:hypothetical protein